jgi:hypothetical protein
MKRTDRSLIKGAIGAAALGLLITVGGCGGSATIEPASDTTIQANKANSEAWQQAKSQYKVPRPVNNRR